MKREISPSCLGYCINFLCPWEKYSNCTTAQKVDRCFTKPSIMSESSLPSLLTADLQWRPRDVT